MAKKINPNPKITVNPSGPIPSDPETHDPDPSRHGVGLRAATGEADPTHGPGEGLGRPRRFAACRSAAPR
jgi:hypothetical protein